MQTLRLLAIAGAMAVSSVAFAQFSTGGSSKSSSASADALKGYDMVTLSYTNSPLNPKHGDDISMNGFSLGYTHGFSISSTHPIFIETGVILTAVFHSDSESEYDDDYDYSVSIFEQNYSLSVPVNFAWKFAINDKFSVKPFVGFNFKGNLYGSTKASVSYDGEDETVNWYDKDDMGDDGVFKRFQMGWHIGAGLQYSSFYLGLNYGTDFIKIHKNISSSTFDLSVGLCF